MDSFITTAGRLMLKGLRAAALSTVVLAMAACSGDDAPVISETIAPDAVDL